MKFGWKLNLTDFAAWNSGQVEEIQIMEFEEMLVDNEEEDKWLLSDDSENFEMDIY